MVFPCFKLSLMRPLYLIKNVLWQPLQCWQALSLMIGLCFLSGHAYSYTLPSSDTTQLQADPYLKRMSQALINLAQKSKKALVFISTSSVITQSNDQRELFEFFFGPLPGDTPKGQPKKREGIGSGFFVDIQKGYIVTNNHVIEDTEDIQLKLANGKTYKGEIVGRDKNTDVAVIKVADDKFDRNGVSQLVFHEGQVRPGEMTMALGAPFSLEASVSIGTVSATKRQLTQITALSNFIQTDAAINPGNSGGPLINMAGLVIGVNTAIFSRSGASAGVGFAIPSQLARLVAESIIAKGQFDRGFIGIHMQDLTPEIADHFGVSKSQSGVLVTEVLDGPAKKVGIKEGDVIVALNKKPVKSYNDLILGIGIKAPGSSVLLTIIRDGVRKNMKLILAKWPDKDLTNNQDNSQHESSENNQLGLMLRPLSPTLKKSLNYKSDHGLVVTRVMEGGLAEKAGLLQQDLILSVNSQMVTTVKSFETLINKSNKPLLRLERNGSFLFVPMSTK
ncbi:MAG: trypsin-like peptidase domain-containing protein [Proteobacteria bacterium]|nr:trypsin-like peptidase domain-containing protein [Pseudomonadota bacterium]